MIKEEEDERMMWIERFWTEIPMRRRVKRKESCHLHCGEKFTRIHQCLVKKAEGRWFPSQVSQVAKDICFSRVTLQMLEPHYCPSEQSDAWPIGGPSKRRRRILFGERGRGLRLWR